MAFTLPQHQGVGRLQLAAPARLRLLAAAVLAFELGQVEVVTKLLEEAERLEPGPIERARIMWVDVAVNTVVRIRPLGGARPARSMTESAEAAGRGGDRVLHVDLLGLVATG